ncbi:hypothetical protein HYPSUDRAFT_200294 [Hypholoma sublateritium FD-334 SS-4]|uniref:F-box domain-containing protein n=1 Tax=Hypholoma sublateritium (strain FD-334 SS-4) TaxID=945553 RepID=A0A0D2MLM5_HYPSF|nr:hypothetical protein HYPSUDRAFT_200294 [Hypholoma sublateritium FD-334 SS-4]
MSARTSPIKWLNLDVLWHTFDINADTFDDDTALKTTLATSRVCREWRSFLLSSTYIWAHIMDLDHPLWNSVEGSREIISRSGTALIWVKTCSYKRAEANINIVKQNWERIQKLRVTIHHKYLGSSSYWPAPRRDYLQSTLYRPAPHLESFSISFDMRMQSIYRDLLPNVFDGNAPMLHEIRLSGPRFTGAEMPWGQQLHSLELTAELTVDQILGAMAVRSWKYSA